MGKGKRMYTRTSLTKLFHKSPSMRTKFLREFGLPATTEDHGLFNLILQRQAEDRLILWQDSESYDAKTPRRPCAPIKQVPFKHLSHKIATSEAFGGLATLSKGFQDSGAGIAKLVAEINPAIRKHEKRVFTQATVLDNNDKLTVQKLTQAKVEIHIAGPPCQSHSVGNDFGKGVKDVLGGGMEYQQSVCTAAAAHDGLGVACMIIENSSEVLRRKDNKTSAYQNLLQNCPNYHEGIEAKAADEDHAEAGESLAPAEQLHLARPFGFQMGWPLSSAAKDLRTFRRG